MAEYGINKGIGRSVEFKGLRAQYLFLFAGGLLTIFVIFVIMYMIGVNTITCILFGIVSATALIWFAFYLNNKYGSHGLMKLFARRQHPRRILSRKRVLRLIRNR